jgi:hypothetical protein
MRPYSNDLRDRIVAVMESGMSCWEAEAPTGTSCIFTDDWKSSCFGACLTSRDTITVKLPFVHLFAATNLPAETAWSA